MVDEHPPLDVGIDDARALIERRFPEVDVATIIPFGEGWDNVVYLVNDSIVFRFPRREPGGMCMESEMRITPLVAEAVTHPISHATHIGVPDDAFPWYIVGHEIVRGVPIEEFIDRKNINWTYIASSLATVLREVHNIDITMARSAGAVDDTIGRMDFSKRGPRSLEYLDRIHKAGELDDCDILAHIINNAMTLPDALDKALVHGDLYGRHLMVSEKDQQVTGVIDWGDVHIGEIAEDFLIVHHMFDAHTQATFREAYGPIDDVTWERGRFRGANHVLAIAGQTGEMHQDQKLHNYAISALKNICTVAREQL